VTSLGNDAELLLATARVLFGHEAHPGGKVSSRSKCSRVGNTCYQRGGQRRPDSRNRIKPFARLIGSMPGHDMCVERQDLRLVHVQQQKKWGCTLASDRCNAIILRISDDIEQLFDTVS